MTATRRPIVLLLAQSPAIVAVAIAHLFYNLYGGVWLGGGWTLYGGGPFAWTIPPEMPAVWIHDSGLPAARPLSGVWLLAVSLTVGYAIVAAAVRWRRGGRLIASKWQVAVLILGLIWIPVPEAWSLAYQYTVRY
jgi:hypothetical protein